LKIGRKGEREMTLHSRIIGSASAAVAGLIAGLLIAGLAQAGQTTGFQSINITFSLAAGASTAPIILPVNRPVEIIATDTTGGSRGISQVTIFGTASAVALWWNGLDAPTSPSGGASISSGSSDTPGTHIVFLDFSHTVDLEVNNGISIIVHSTGATPQNPQAGFVTLMF
jgi:hypothetical protein